MKALCLASPDTAEYLLRACVAGKDLMLSRVQRSSHGTCRISTDDVAQFPIPLPPLDEQRRIVAKVDELMALCDELEARQQERRAVQVRLNDAALDRLTSADSDTDFASAWTRVRRNFDLLYSVPENVHALRQVILQLAVQGKLVKWTAPPQSLPLADLLSENSLNGYGKKPSDAPPGIPILRISAGTCRQDAVVEERDHKFAELTDEEIEKFRLVPGDLLACRFNGNLHYVGRFSIYTGSLGVNQVYPDKLIRFRVDPKKAIPQYVRYAMNSAMTRQVIEGMCATTAGNIGISATRLKSVVIPVPEIELQKLVVERIDQLLALCDNLETELSRRRADASRLAEAIVASILNSPADLGERTRQ